MAVLIGVASAALALPPTASATDGCARTTVSADGHGHNTPAEARPDVQCRAGCGCAT